LKYLYDTNIFIYIIITYLNTSQPNLLAMTNITIFNIDDNIKNFLQQRASKNGSSIEEEVKEILRLALIENQKPPVNFVNMIEKRFAHLEDFELGEVTREPMRPAPTFE
jgi:plasmid stability protein